MDIVVLGVGRLRPSYRAAADEYLRRLGRYANVRELSVREASRAPTAPVQRRDEAKRLQAKLPAKAILVALTRTGDPWSSRAIARSLERWSHRGLPLIFLLGGSTGLDPNLVARADARWSLGPLTLPHELARVIVYEQVYRGFTILRGEKYHKGE